MISTLRASNFPFIFCLALSSGSSYASVVENAGFVGPQKKAQVFDFKEYLQTRSTNAGVAVTLESDPVRTFVDDIKDYYAELAASQEPFDRELEQILLANLSDLYED